MAAAYLFHIIRDHPFVDGNKRTGLIAAIVFLALNDFAFVAEQNELLDMVHGVADRGLSKAHAAVFVQEHARARPSSR